jgi:hypothetical protein
MNLALLNIQVMDKLKEILESNSKPDPKKIKEKLEEQDKAQNTYEPTTSNDPEREKYLKIFEEVRKKHMLTRADQEADEYIVHRHEVAEYNRWSLKLGQKWLNSFLQDQFWTKTGIALLKYKYILDHEIINLQVCKDFIEGYYFPKDHKIVLCANNLTNYEKNYRFYRALKRHLILLFDHVRSTDYDFNNCQHLACSEVRAAKLGGYCQHSYKYFNGFFAPDKNEAFQKGCIKSVANEHMMTYYDHCKNEFYQ